MSINHGLVWWSELNTRDVAAARAFYEKTCGWVFETVPMPEGDYHIAHAHGRPVAGIMDLADLPGMEGVPPHWFTYIAVDDLDAALVEAEAAGGTTTRPPFEVEGTGRIAITTDASGAPIGLMTPSTGWESPDAIEEADENLPV